MKMSSARILKPRFHSGNSPPEWTAQWIDVTLRAGFILLRPLASNTHVLIHSSTVRHDWNHKVSDF